jgi:hypothetical protein
MGRARHDAPRPITREQTQNRPIWGEIGRFCVCSRRASPITTSAVCGDVACRMTSSMRQIAVNSPIKIVNSGGLTWSIAPNFTATSMSPPARFCHAAGLRKCRRQLVTNTSQPRSRAYFGDKMARPQNLWPVTIAMAGDDNFELAAAISGVVQLIFVARSRLAWNTSYYAQRMSFSTKYSVDRMAESRVQLWSVRGDGGEECGHLVDWSARHGVVGFVADLCETIPDFLDGQRGTVETFCPTDEEARDVSGANGVDLAGNRAVPVASGRRPPALPGRGPASAGIGSQAHPIRLDPTRRRAGRLLRWSASKRPPADWQFLHAVDVGFLEPELIRCYR